MIVMDGGTTVCYRSLDQVANLVAMQPEEERSPLTGWMGKFFYDISLNYG